MTRLLLCFALLLPLGACDDDSDEKLMRYVLPEGTPSTATVGETIQLKADVFDSNKDALTDECVVASVTRGGGSVAMDGYTISWTLGRLPIANSLRLAFCDHGIDDGEVSGVTMTPTLPEPLAHEVWSDVDSYLSDAGNRGSTEDLAFVGDEMLLGVPGAILKLGPDGTTSEMALSGDDVGRPLGIAVDADGVLWYADAENGALKRVGTDGAVSTALEGMEAPNYTAVGPDGHIYVTDPCGAELIRLDPSDNSVVARHTFDLPTEGGPNGLAFDADGRLWGVTESTALLCNDVDTVELTAPIAVLFAIDVTADGFGERENVIDSIGLIGDGLAFDVDGNLYYVSNENEGATLKECAIWLLRAGETTPVKVLVAAEDTLFANLAFGPDAFGSTTMYIVMLAFPGFGNERGVHRVDVGVAGLPLLP